MYLFDLKINVLVEVEIVDVEFKDFFLRKDGWNFNWRIVFKEKNMSIYILRLKLNFDVV